jgi:hypothetical protein
MISRQTPEAFSSLGPLEKLFVSIFSRSENLGPWSDTSLPVLKAPFSVSFAELHEFAAVDVRISGWGPLFSGILIATMLCSLALVARRMTVVGNWPSISMVISYSLIALVFPEGWWARYAVYLPLIPALIAFLAFSTVNSVLISQNRMTQIGKKGATAIAVLFLANSLMLVPFSVANVNSANAKINSSLQDLLENKVSSDVIEWEKLKFHLEPFLADKTLLWKEISRKQGQPPNCVEIQDERLCLVKSPKS